MTKHSTLRKTGDAQLSADRHQASQAGRPALEGKARATQLVHCIEVAKQDQRWADARAFQAQLKPIMHLLPEGN